MVILGNFWYFLILLGILGTFGYFSVLLNKFVLVLTGICPYHTGLYNLTFSKSLALIALALFLMHIMILQNDPWPIIKHSNEFKQKNPKLDF